ncbi:FAD/NAD(P)-binding protein [Cytobacillus spongiae]|uniref:SidA/IucD/PvdA family monooxygenase n=1 Tax=Cytobacillus spongiae TaxID=2901381 RepID=UPI001F437B18|nr:FAD/NAD(P)-binding protein [Cytobacillus spongiae]UII56137.1 FAD/NAD(P)-binding protein [Cytobacillus spongiae]
MFEWVIIGGGIHGCTIANYLIKSGKTTIDDLLIIDSHKEPMEKWKKLTSRIGMEYLRSPSVHHIDVNAFSLQNFRKLINHTEFYGQYKRPSLALFNEHCDSIITNVHLKDCWEQGRVIHVNKEEGKWKIETDKGQSVLSNNLVISISVNEDLHIPKWVNDLGEESASHISHIFSEELTNLNDLTPPILVVGGGITAAHTVIKLCGLFPGKVTLLSRHRFRVHGFDSDPGWLGPKNMKFFSEIEDYKMRREEITNARHKGSIPNDIYQKLIRLEKQGALRLVFDEVEAANKHNHEISINLKGGSGDFAFKHIILATGFESKLPEKGWLKQLIQKENLACATCGYPIVNQGLEWCPHLYVSGPLAELEIGPTARNISGARKAAERIVNYSE